MYDEAELLEAKRQINFNVHKIQELIKTFEAKGQPERVNTKNNQRAQRTI